MEYKNTDERVGMMNNTIVFYDERFPYDGGRPDVKQLRLLKGHFKVVDAEQFIDVLNNQNTMATLINLHGPYFPKDAWTGILAYLQSGKGFVHIGGAPFRIPVVKGIDGEWNQEREQTAYHQKLQIHEVLPVDHVSIDRLEADEHIPVFSGWTSLFSIQPTYNLIMHVTKSKDLPNENGSGGPMDAHIYPLLKGMSKDNRAVAASAVLIENTKGLFAGGRWLFINQSVESRFWDEGGVDALMTWANFSSKGVTEIWLKPNYATYDPGDQPTLTIQIEKIVNAVNETKLNEETWHFTIDIYNHESENKEKVWSVSKKMTATSHLQFKRILCPFNVSSGFYTVECTAQSTAGESRFLKQGFWGYDDALLKQGDILTHDRDYFRKNGQPFPIVGQTYMTSDVARKYLFMPNVSVWDQDMSQMKQAGINLIRTGLWTGWRHIMFVDGHAHEEVLRAIDAFILTAKKYDIEVTFNFFAFTPEAFEGQNPYLDPRSVKAQKRFISSIVTRHAETKNVHWDLINEPSMFDPKRIFQGPRSSHDAFEKQAFQKWLSGRHRSIEQLQERWNMTPGELPEFSAVELPEQNDINFDVHDMKQPKKGLSWLDYTLFTMDMHNQWVKSLTDAIKFINSKQLITVGQDEGLSSMHPSPLSEQRPTPFFYAEAVDYTTVHSWWRNDDLIWDGIFTKTPYKPNLVQETGIMYVETPDGKGKRSEFELRNILERKYAYAFATGGAGAVQWLWNTNYFMNNVNESNIGAVRADGTQKPEADVSYDFGSFIHNTRDLFEDRKLEDIVIIFPHSNDFSNRKVAYDATTKLSRILTYDMHLPFRAMGEYQLDGLADFPPKLIIVPSAHNFSTNAQNELLQHVKEKGGTILWTGPLGLNEYWEHNNRLQKEVGSYTLSNILREEMLECDGELYPVSFGQRRIAEINKEILNKDVANKQGVTTLVDVPIGKGKLIWSALPIELNEQSEVITAVYRQALSIAGVKPELEWLKGGDLPGIYGRKLTFREGYLFVFVSEYAADTTVKVKDYQTEKCYTLELERERSILFTTDKNGQIVTTYRPDAVNVLVE